MNQRNISFLVTLTPGQNNYELFKGNEGKIGKILELRVFEPATDLKTPNSLSGNLATNDVLQSCNVSLLQNSEIIFDQYPLQHIASRQRCVGKGLEIDTNLSLSECKLYCAKPPTTPSVVVFSLSYEKI